MQTSQKQPKVNPFWKPSRRNYIMPVTVLVIGVSFTAFSFYLFGQPPATQAVLSFGRGIVFIKDNARYSLTVSSTTAVSTTGTVYRLDSTHSTVQKFDANGRLLTEWGGAGSQQGQFKEPELIAVDRQGQVYVYDNVNSIQKFDSDGHLLAKLPGLSGGNTPLDMVVNATGEISLLVRTADTNYFIQKLNSDGQLLMQTNLDWKWATFYAVQFDSEGQTLYTLSEAHNGPITGINYNILDTSGNNKQYLLFSNEDRISSRIEWGLLFLIVLVVVFYAFCRLIYVILKDCKIILDVPYQRLKSPYTGLRAMGVTQLGLLADPASFEPLLQAFHDPEILVRGNAAWALGQLGDARAVEPLLGALPREDFQVQVNIIMALGVLRDSRALEPLLFFLHSPYPDLRACSAAALGKLGDARAVGPLREALFGGGEYNVCQSLAELGQLGQAVLLEVLNQPDPVLRSNAAIALNSAGGSVPTLPQTQL